MASNFNEERDGVMAAYKIGDHDERPWGSYVVTAVGHAGGEEYCEKEITVRPGQILSLQSHELRREHWRVEKGTLTVVLDGERLTLNAGEDVRIPLRGVHCMANLGKVPCVVHERQEGVCREEDIRRYVDAYGRATEDVPEAASSIGVYREILAEIGHAAGPKNTPRNGR